MSAGKGGSAEVLVTISTLLADAASPADSPRSLANGGAGQDRTPQLRGSLSRALVDGEVIQVSAGGKVVGVVPARDVDATALTWSFDLRNPLPQTKGTTHQFQARVINRAGSSLGPLSAAWAYRLDTQAPAPAQVQVLGALKRGTVVLSSGQLRITRLESDAVAGVLLSTQSGWSPLASPELTLGQDGPQTVVIRQTDAAGNVSLSPPISIVVDRSAPVLQQLTLSADGADLLLRFDEPVLAGRRAAASFTLQLESGGQPLVIVPESVTADANSLRLRIPLNRRRLVQVAERLTLTYAPALNTTGSGNEVVVTDLISNPLRPRSVVVTPDPVVLTPRRWLSFSGGGWNSHSLLAGLFAGALDRIEQQGTEARFALGDLMRYVKGISANSGGSWFLSQLAYSSRFLDQFDTINDRDNYTTTGYNGAVRRIISSLPSIGLGTEVGASLKLIRDWLVANFGANNPTLAPTLDWIEFLGKALRFLGSNAFDWRPFVEELVFRPFGMNSELAAVGLDDPRQAWAFSKDLVIATAAATSPAVLETTIGATIDSTLVAATPTLSGAQTRPLGIVSRRIPSGDLQVFLDNPGTDPMSINYSSDRMISPPDPLNVNVSLPVGMASDLGVIDATVASSSALALLAQPRAFTIAGNEVGPIERTLASGFQRLSPLAQFRDGVLMGQPVSLIDRFKMPASQTLSSAFDTRYQQAAALRQLRLMDGGYADNTSASSMLRQIQQDQGTSRPFDLTIFVNSSEDPLTGVRMPIGPGTTQLSSYRVPRDVSLLFGRNSGGVDALSGMLVQGPFPAPMVNQVPSPQIFKVDAWRGETQPEWQFRRDSVSIQYFDLNVTTVANRQFGISAGQAGRVRLFISNNSESFAAPRDLPMLQEYDQNYSFARAAIRDAGGGAHLFAALGLDTPIPLVPV